MKRLLLASGMALASLTGCGFFESREDFHGVPQDPPDLTVHQSPNDTVRVGETVTLTAVFKDSLNPKWFYNWMLNVDGAVLVGRRERSVQWTPTVSGDYRGQITVNDARVSSLAALSFSTTVLP